MKKIIYLSFFTILFTACLAAPEKSENHQCESCEIHSSESADDYTDHEYETADESGHEAMDDHSGHDHETAEENGEHEDTDDHSGHDHETADTHAEHDHAGHTDVVEGINIEKNSQFEIVSAVPAVISSESRLQGTIENYPPETIILTPRIAGIISEVFFQNGEKVKKGDILAEVESPELAEILAGYMENKLESVCCALDHKRAVEIYDAVRHLSDFLKKNPDIDELKKIDFSLGGEYAAELVSMYGDYVYSRQIYDREKKLYEKKIGKEEDYFNARKEYLKFKAVYESGITAVAFKTLQQKSEEEIKLKTSRVSLDSAISYLNMLGYSKEDIAMLESEYDIIENHECSDPECSNCRAATYSKNLVRDMVTKYKIKSPSEGIISEINFFPGMNSKEGNIKIMTGKKMMVNLKLYGKDRENIQKSSVLHIFDLNSDFSESGMIHAVSPVINNESGAQEAYVVLDNPHGKWKPGMQIYGIYASAKTHASVTVPSESIQYFEGKPVVFVKSGTEAELRFVITGMTDSHNIQILSGLKPGEEVVGKGSFDLKAALITGSMDAHAGHGH